MFKIGWFSTGRDEAAIQLLEYIRKAIESGAISAKISYVFCNREPGEYEQSDKFTTAVRRYDIPLVCFSFDKYREKYGRKTASTDNIPQEWRSDYDSQVIALLRDYDTDIVVLAGYMLIVSPVMCNRFKMINLHPALPHGPTGTWQEVIWKLIEQGAEESGAMMHRVTPELDRGPVVTYCRYSIRGNDFDLCWNEINRFKTEEIKFNQGERNSLFQKIRETGLIREFPLILYTVKAFSERQLHFSNDKIVNRQGNLIQGYDLTEAIDKEVAKDMKIDRT